MRPELQKKVDRAIRLLKSFNGGGNEVIELSYSGGKDSDVILELAKMAGINFRAIYKNTTIDPPGTIKHCKENGVEIMQPKERFFDIVKRKGIPTRRARFCCEVMKEYKVLDKAIQGVRRAESAKRSKRYKATDPIICRVYGSKKNHVNVCLPILNWTDNDIAEFIAERGIKCHPLYYDEKGNFHVERRLGCLGCPLKSDNGVSDFLKYPNLLKALIRSAKIWYDTHPNAKSHKKFFSVYDLVYQDLFCKSYEDYKQRVAPDLWGNTIDCKAELEKYFNIKL